MLTNANITIYNKFEDKETRALIWYRTVLIGVSAYVNTKSSQINNSGRQANEASFRIPASCNEYNRYLPPFDWINEEYPEDFWTVNVGDIIVNGICDIDITGISTLESNGYQPLRICAVSDNRRGLNPHIRVRCE